MIGWPLRPAIDEIECNDGGYVRDMSDATPRSARMVSRVVHLLTSVALVWGVAMPAAAQGPVQPVGVAAYTIVEAPEGPVQTTAFEIDGDLIRALYVVRNPDKLRHLAGVAAQRDR